MNRSGRLTLTLLGLGLVLAALAACGGGSDGSPTSSSAKQLSGTVTI